MALTTFSGLKSSIADWLNRSDLTTQIADFIALTEADFNAKLRIRQMEQIDTITIDSEPESEVVHTATFKFPALQIVNVRPLSTGEFRPCSS